MRRQRRRKLPQRVGENVRQHQSERTVGRRKLSGAKADWQFIVSTIFDAESAGDFATATGLP